MATKKSDPTGSTPDPCDECEGAAGSCHEWCSVGGEGRKSPSPKWLEGKHHSNTAISKGHETRITKKLGGKKYRGSGNRRWSRWSSTSETDKGDLATPEFHFEHKFTRDKSISLKLEWLDKVGEGARLRKKDPGLIITFHGGPAHAPEDWVMVRLEALEQLLKKVSANDED